MAKELTVSPSTAKISIQMATISTNADIGLVTIVDPRVRPLAGSIVQDAYDVECPWHHHDMHQIQYAFEGAIELEDAHARHLLPQSLAGWIPAGVTHRDSIRRIRSISLLLSPDLVRDSGGRVRIIRVPPIMRAMIAEAARWPLDGHVDTTGQMFFRAFGRLCEEWIADEAPLTLPTTTDPALASAIAYIRTNLADATLAGSCDAAGLSERTLRRRFRRLLGTNWDAYRRRARLLTAIEVLAGTDMSIASIAAHVGFESQSAFAKAFFDLIGETPSSYRRRICLG